MARACGACGFSAHREEPGGDRHADAAGQRSPRRCAGRAPDDADALGNRRPHARKHIHARAETVDRLPSFRAAFAQRRGLVVVSSFNEGREITPTRTEQHVITPPAPIAIAVIWDGAPPCFAMVTVPPNALIATLTDRMPAVLAAEDWDRWLTGTPGASKALLRPMEGDWEMQPEARDPRQGTLF